jgi:hypothetical protein
MILKKTGDGKAVERESRRMLLPGVALAGLMMASGCGLQANQVPATIPVRSYLKEAPVSMAEMVNEAGRGAQVGGRVADCKGKAVCIVPLYPGDIFLIAKFMPEEGGNLEISVVEEGDGGIVFKKRVDFNFSIAQEETRLFKCGESARLFETDISIRIEKSERGVLVAIVQ